MTDRERLQWVLTVIKGVERIIELQVLARDCGVGKYHLEMMTEGIRLMALSSPEFIANNKNRFEEIEAWAQKYDR